jgi:hypothetical protein
LCGCPIISADLANQKTVLKDDTGSIESGTDEDGDGYTAENGDCNDNDATVYPGAADTYGDGSDQNCDGTDGVDADGDGVASAAGGGPDCDDGNSGLGDIALDAD